VILLAALAVVATSGLPAFYASERVGKGGKTFRMWKLRTMCRDADRVLESWLADPEFARSFQAHYKVDNDPRITRLGNLLRRSSIDELPQLLNVVRGEMSLVGPRPLSSAEIEHFGARSAELLSVRPGITGYWQVTRRNRVAYPDRVLLELSSVRDCGFVNDVLVLLRTLLVPLKLDGR
jgi:lipopolysaccharide/colanic/teichoic acid biosynthesis glycosyltransferase